MSKHRRPAAIALLAAAGAVVLAACGSSGNSSSGSSAASTVAGGYGTVPAAHGTPKAGGTVTYAEPPGDNPTWILPLVPSADNTVFSQLDFLDQMWRPLYWPNNGVQPGDVPAMSLANAPTYSGGDTTVTFTVKPQFRWSDGRPLSANDVIFDIDEIKAAIKQSPGDWAPYVPGLFPDDLASATAASATKVVLHLTSPVNPQWFTEDVLGTLNPMPSHAWARASAGGPILDFTNPANAAKIYTFLAAQSKSLNTYATNPLWRTVDGPWKLTAYNSATGAFTMVRNTGYGGPAPGRISVFKGVPFTSDAAQFNALKAGSLDVGYVPLADVPDVPQLKRAGYDVFGYSDWGFNYIAYNFKDTTGGYNKIIGQVYIRQAIAHLQDEKGYINAFFHGAGAPAYGPVPSLPKSPYTPADATTNPFPFGVAAAKTLLSSHGWAVHPGGTDVCTRPGTGSNECGAGIPAGAKLAFTLIYTTAPGIIGEQVTALASEAKQAGIEITLKSSNFNFMVQNYNDTAAPANDGKWEMEDFGGFAFATAPYPAMNTIFSSTGSTNLGGYSDPTADRLIKAAISSSNPSAVKQEASYLTRNPPGLFQPNFDYIWAWKSDISGQPASFENLSQYFVTPEYWSYIK